MSRTSRIVTTLGLVAVVVFGSQSAAVAADGWWPISNKEGIVVTGKDRTVHWFKMSHYD